MPKSNKSGSQQTRLNTKRQQPSPEEVIFPKKGVQCVMVLFFLHGAAVSPSPCPHYFTALPNPTLHPKTWGKEERFGTHFLASSASSEVWHSSSSAVYLALAEGRDLQEHSRRPLLTMER